MWLGFAISAEIHCVTAVAWCVSGVSNPDFPNFTKHSTVLTSILQQINILYQHFPFAETALPALEQAKTMLKIALPTFKNDENHTQNSKIHTQNSVFEVRCGECGGGFLHFGYQGGEMVVRLRHVLSWLRRFLCVIQMIARFICGENAVRKWRNGGVFAACTCFVSCILVSKVAKLLCGDGGWDLQFRLKFIVLRRLRSAFRAFPTMISRISQSIPPFSPPFYSKSTPYINISHLSKPPYRHSNRRKQC